MVDSAIDCATAFALNIENFSIDEQRFMNLVALIQNTGTYQSIKTSNEVIFCWQLDVAGITIILEKHEQYDQYIDFYEIYADTWFCSFHWVRRYPSWKGHYDVQTTLMGIVGEVRNISIENPEHFKRDLFIFELSAS